MLRVLGLILVIGCSSCTEGPTVEDSAAPVEEGLCPWVETQAIPLLANCTRRITGGGGPVEVSVFDEFGRVLSESDQRELLFSYEYDGRGRLVTVLDGDGNERQSREWNGCNYYSYTEERRDAFSEIEVALRDSGEIERTASRYYFSGRETDRTSYTTEWEGDRLMVETKMSYESLRWQTTHTYGTDELGRFESWERLNGTGGFEASGATWFDELGRVVQTREQTSQNGRRTVWVTTYDGTGADATSTRVLTESPRFEEGSVVTYFRPDGRIERIVSISETDETTRNYEWDCAASDD